MRFSIYRYNPEADDRPRMQHYDIALEPTDRMLLDALVRIKAHDDTLAFRRSCREGVCGSDGMNINGKNGLACITRIAELKEPVVIRPLPGLPVVRDLIVDMSQFFKQYNSVKPYLINHEAPPEKERLQSPEDREQRNSRYGSSRSSSRSPVDHELRGRMPEGTQSDAGDRKDQGPAGQARRVSSDGRDRPGALELPQGIT